MIQTSKRPASRRAMRASGELERRREAKAARKTPTFRFTESLGKRQNRREMSGFYEGTMALAHLLGQRHGRLGRQRDDTTGKLVRMR